MFLLSLFMTAALAQTLPWQDQEFGCFDQATAQRYIRDFNVDVSSFGGLELCRSQVDTKKLLNDLLIIEKGLFSPQRQNVFIRGFVPADGYYSWMKSQTRGMNRGNDIPSATAYNRGGYFTMQDGWAVLSTLGRVGTVIHEARHTAGYRHLGCSQGPYQGAPVSGCDRDYAYGGSHAVEMEYYARVSVQGTNFHPVYKSMARLMAIARSNFVFNQPVIQKREGLLALSATQGRADLIVDGQIFPREAPATPGVLKRTSFGGVLFNGQEALSIELYGSEPLRTSIGDTYSYFKLLLEDPRPVFDFEEFDIGTKRYVALMRNRTTLQFFDFPRGEWGRALNLNFEVAGLTTRLENGQSGFFAIDRSGAIYPIGPERRSVGAALPVRWSSDIVSIAALNQRVYVLKTDGVIYESSVTRGYRPQSQNRDRYRGLVNAPVYDGFEVER
ncbi:MAG: hypothetical protein ACK5Y2_07845 [Bdellovibrionales bacterium]